MSQHDNLPSSKKHITTGDILWTLTCICVGFLLIYIFYLLMANISNTTLYREILHR